MLRLHPRRGFALPMAILLIVMLTSMLVAGVVAATAEVGTNASQRAQTRAYEIAQGGIEQFLVNRTTLCAATGSHCIANPDTSGTLNDSDYVRVAIPGGYADVVAYQVRPKVNDTLPAMFFITARGSDTTYKLSGGGVTTKAQRTIGTFAYYNSYVIDVLAGWTALSGLQKNGGSGEITGVDQCPSSQGGGKASVAGVALPDNPGYDQNGGSESGVLSGSPMIDSLGSQSTANAKVKIDWDGIVNHGAITPDVTIPGSSFPSSSAFTDTTYWPVIMIQNYGGSDYSLPNKGRGTLIVTGNLVISGSDMWSGVVLVGGVLTSNGNNTVQGATVTGLNEKLGISVPQNDVGNGTKTFAYNSCSVSQAGKGMRSYVPMPNTWMDNVASW